MPKPKRTTPKKTVAEVEEPTIGTPEEEYEDVIPEVDALRAQFGDGGYQVRIMKKGDTGLWENFPAQALEAFDPDAVASLYGGGEYRFKVINADKQFVKHFTATYSKLIKPRSEAAPSTAPVQDPQMSLIFQMMQQQNQAMQTLMGEVIKAIAAKPAGTGPQEILMLAEGLRKLGENPKAESSNAEMVKSTLSIAKDMFKAGMEMNSSRDPEDTLLTRLTEKLPELLDKFTTRPPQPPPPPPRVTRKPLEEAPPPAPAPAPAAPPAAVPPPGVPIETEHAVVVGIIKNFGPDFLRMATDKANPKEVAQHFLEKIPDGLDDQISAFAEDPTAADLIFKVYTPLSAYSEWVKELLKAIAENFEENPDEGQPTPQSDTTEAEVVNPTPSN